MIEVKTASQNAKTEVKIWQWLLSLLQWYGAEGMGSDETSVEDREIVYRVKVLLWRSSRLAVATSSCFVLSCSVGAHFRFIPYRLPTHYKADSTPQVPLVIRSDIYP
jgi:hypothetical protein